jgi:DNA polymerase III delta prime subunit
MYHVSSVIAVGDESSIPALLKQENIKPDSPDTFIKVYRSFGISDAQDIQRRAITRPVVDGHRSFVMTVPSITTEAQNALLKTIEEPRANAAFYFLTRSPNTLLSTVLSRSQIKEIKGSKLNESIVDVDDFLAATKDKRITMLKPLYEHEDEGRDIGAVIAFLAALENRFAEAKKSTEASEGIHAIYRARKYATDKGSLLKALLEQVALLAPKM